MSCEISLSDWSQNQTQLKLRTIPVGLGSAHPIKSLAAKFHSLLCVELSKITYKQFK